MTHKRLLTPSDPFPADLSKLTDTRLHILHSQVVRQLELEYLQQGIPETETEFRCEELRNELEARDARDSLSGEITPADTLGAGSLTLDGVLADGLGSAGTAPAGFLPAKLSPDSSPAS